MDVDSILHILTVNMSVNIMSVKSSTELMLYVVLTMPTLNKAYLFIIYYKHENLGANDKNRQ